jgi:hypothetical protein
MLTSSKLIHSLRWSVIMRQSNSRALTVDWRIDVKLDDLEDHCHQCSYPRQGINLEKVKGQC